MGSEIRRSSADDPGETASSAPVSDHHAVHWPYQELTRQELDDLPDYDGEVPAPLEGADPGNEDPGEPAETTGLGEGYHSAEEYRAWLAARNAGERHAAAAGESGGWQEREQPRPDTWSAADTEHQNWRGEEATDGSASGTRDARPDSGADEQRWAAMERRVQASLDSMKAHYEAKLDEIKAEHKAEIESVKAEYEGALRSDEARIGALEARVTGTDSAADRDADRVADSGADAERVEQLENELVESHASQRKLIDAISRRDDKVDKLEDQNHSLRDENRSLRDEVAQLRVELAEARAAKKGKDQPTKGGDQPPEEHAAAQHEIASEEKGEARAERRQKRVSLHLPGERAATAITGVAGAVETIAASTHVLTGTEKDIIGAVGIATVGLYLWGKGKFDGWQERKRNADRRED